MIKIPYANLLNHEIIHLLLTFLAAGIVWICLRKKRKDTPKITLLVALGAFIGEFLLDTDHLLEYFFAYGLSFRMDYFLKANMFHELQKIFVIFHAWL